MREMTYETAVRAYRDAVTTRLIDVARGTIAGTYVVANPDKPRSVSRASM
jgi:hypothetical protein